MSPPATGARASARNDRAALGVIATFLHELTEHGRPRERDEDAERTERITDTVRDELADRRLVAA